MKAFYHAFLEATSIVSVTDTSGKIVHVNDNFCHACRFSREELIGNTHKVINSGYHPKSFFADMWATISQGNTWKGLICNKVKDGTLHWLDTTIVPELDTNGKPVRYHSSRVVYDDELIRAKHRSEMVGDLKLVQDYLREVIYSCRLDDFSVIYISQNCKEIYGYEIADFLADPSLFMEIVHPDDRPMVEKNMEKLLKNENAEFRYRIKDRSGVERQMLNRAYITSKDGTKLINGIARDITSTELDISRNTDQALRAQKLLDVIDHYLITIDKEHRIRFINQSGEDYFGQPRTKLIGRSIQEVFPQLGKLLDIILRHDFQVDAENREHIMSMGENQRIHKITIYHSDNELALLISDIHDQEDAARKLRDSKVKLKAILDSTSDSNILIGPDYRILSFNQMTGELTRQLLGKEMKSGDLIWDYMGKEVRDDFVANFERAMKGEKVVTEREIFYGNNISRWFKVRYFPVKDPHGEVIGVSFNSTDIHEQITAKKKLEASELLFQQASEGNPECQFAFQPVWIDNERESYDFIFLKCNLKGEELIGKNRKEILGSRLTSTLDIYQNPQIFSQLVAVMKNGQSTENEFYVQQGLHKGWYRHQLVKSGDNLFVSLKNITEDVEQARLFEYLSLVARKTTNSVIIADAEGRIEWVNNAFTKITGYHLGEIKGKRPGKILQGEASDPEIISYMHDRLDSGESFDVDIINYDKSGSPYWVNIIADPIYSEVGNLTGFISIQTNISEKKAKEEWIQKQNQHLKEIAWYQSHRIRGPVATLLGLVNVLDTKKPDSSFNRTVLESIEKTALKLDQATHRIVESASKSRWDDLAFDNEAPA